MMEVRFCGVVATRDPYERLGLPGRERKNMNKTNDVDAAAVQPIVTQRTISGYFDFRLDANQTDVTITNMTSDVRKSNKCERNISMTKEQSQAIRNLVAQGGWDAVRNHPELSQVWARALKDSKAYTNAAIDR